MGFIIQIEEVEDLLWLQQSTAEWLKRLKQSYPTYKASIERMTRLYNAAMAATYTKDSPVAQIKAPSKAETKSIPKERASATYGPALCVDHPNYRALRSPRTDCAGCWSAYERVNPNRIQHARANYERLHP